MIVYTKTAEEMLEQIQRRMKEHQAAYDRLDYIVPAADEHFNHFVAKEKEFHRGCMCELRYMRNIIELRCL